MSSRTSGCCDAGQEGSFRHGEEPYVEPELELALGRPRVAEVRRLQDIVRESSRVIGDRGRRREQENAPMPQKSSVNQRPTRAWRRSPSP